MGHVNTTANDADDAAAAPEPIDLTDPATDAQLEAAVLLLEEQKHDADEDTKQGVLKLEQWELADASQPNSKPPKSTKKSKGAKAAGVLVRVSKGMYFPPGSWLDAKTLAEYKQRVTVHKLDVCAFFADTRLREDYKGACVCNTMCVCVCNTMCVCVFRLLRFDLR